MHVAHQFIPYMKQKGHGFLMALFVSVWDIPDSYIHCGFEVKKLMEMLTLDPILKPFSQLYEKGGGGVVEGLGPQKRKHQISPCFCWHLRWTFTACFNVQTGQKMHMIAF